MAVTMSSDDRKRHLTRREFLLATGAATGAAAALGSNVLSAQPPAVPSNVQVNAAVKPVLTPADFTYKGMFKMPLDNIGQVEKYFSYSFAAITGRAHDGNTNPPNLLIMGPQSAGIPGAVDLTEIAVPALNTLATDADFATRVANAPRCTVIRSWARNTVFANMTVVPPNDPVPWGLHYVGNAFGNGTQLFWTFDGSYDVSNKSPTLGTTILNDDGTCTSHGPWGVDPGPKQIPGPATSGYMVDIPATFQAATGCGPLGIGSPRHRNSAAVFSWGANLHAITPPALGAATNTFNSAGGQNVAVDGNGNPWTISAPSTLLYHPSSNPQARNTKVVVCGSNTPNTPYDAALPGCAGGAHVGTGNGLWGNAGASSVSAFLENTCACVWIDGPSKQGVLFIGEMPMTVSMANGFTQDFPYDGTDATNCHYAYQAGNLDGSPATKCCHGQTLTPAWAATGPGAGTVVSYYWIYSPEHFKQVLSGGNTYDPTPTAEGLGYLFGSATGSLAEILSAATRPAGSSKLGQLAIGGAWFDSTNKLLFVSQVAAYGDSAFDQLPVIHVFQVNC
jgi:hypothetical protein